MSHEIIYVPPPLPLGLSDYQNWTTVYGSNGEFRVSVTTVEEFNRIEQAMLDGTSTLTVWHPEHGDDGLWTLTDFHAEKKGWLTYQSTIQYPCGYKDWQDVDAPGVGLQSYQSGNTVYGRASIRYVWGHLRPDPMPVVRGR